MASKRLLPADLEPVRDALDELAALLAEQVVAAYQKESKQPIEDEVRGAA